MLSKSLLSRVIFLLLAMSSSKALAFFEFNAFYFTDSLTSSENANQSYTLFDLALGFPIDRQGRYSVGWNFSSYSVENRLGERSQNNLTMMGPRFLIGINRQKTWTLGLTYNIESSATYRSDSVSQTWKGTAIKADLGYNFELTERQFLAFRLNYLAASFNESLEAGDNYSKVNYARSQMFPSLAYLIVF